MLSRPGTLFLGAAFGLALGLGCRTNFEQECPEGQVSCACVGGEDGTCLESLVCMSGVCVEGSGDETGSETLTTGGDGDVGDGDSGDGDEDADTGGVCDGPVGSTTEGAQESAMLTGEIHARKLNVDCEGRLISVALHSPSPVSLLMRAGVYADDGGVPGALVADTGADSNPGGGWMTLPAQDVVLGPGDYWVAFLIADAPGGDLVAVSHDTVPEADSVSAPASWGDPPAFFPDATTSSTHGWSSYLVLEAP